MNEITLNSNIHSTGQSQPGMPYPDHASWVNAVIVCSGKTAAARLQQGLQPSEGLLKEDFVNLFTFYNASNAKILITIFTQLFSKPYL
jgi:hypothetical protein